MFLLLCKMCLSILIVRVVIASLNAIAILLGCYLSGTQQQNIYMIIYCGFFSFGIFFFRKDEKDTLSKFCLLHALFSAV